MKPRTRAGTILVGTGVAVVAVSAALTFGKVGAGASPTSSSAAGSTPAQPEDPAAFLQRLANALRTGDATFLFDRLNPAVVQRFGASACHTHVAGLTDPTAGFTVQAVGQPGAFAYTTGGQTIVVANTVPIQAIVTLHGTATPETIHLARLASGQLTWFTDCSSTP
jgi:hypothetical protein